MSDYTVPARRRSRSLLIVEGNYEKELYRLIFKAFPELNIDIDDVWIYETNIYELYNDIVKAYGDDWADEETGFIWVLSTCTFLIPDYNFGLVPLN
jgi:hypothetical protein